jgi:hypothetical protein
MQLLINTILVTVSDDQIRRLLLDKLMGAENQGSIIPENPIILPQIGEYWAGHGGIFTGLLPRHEGGFAAVITGPMIDEEADTYQAMKEKAEAIEVDGHKDFRLPFKAEQSLQKATIPQLFKTDDWYWSIERHPEYENLAYAQYFENGYQDYYDTDYACYGCAVRIVVIR